MTAWIKAGVQESGTIVSRGLGFRLDKRVGDLINFGTFGMSNDILESTTAINDDQWHFIGATFDGSTKKLYIDGVVEAEWTDVTGTANQADQSFVIGNQAAIDDPFNGDIDDVLIYDRALSASEISDLFESANTGTPGANQGIIAHYSFDGNANDASVSGNHGIVDGALLALDRFIRTDRAYVFDGIDDVITTPLNLTTNQPFSLSVWVRWDGNSALVQEILSWWDVAQGQSTYLGTTLGGEIRFGDTFTDTGIILAANQWVHLAATYDGSVAKIYVDGSLAATSGSDRQYDFTNGSLNIGKQRTSVSGEFWSGSIDDILIYDRALTDSDVLEVYYLDQFVTTWLTTSTSEPITIPTNNLSGYNYKVNWGDGTVETANFGDATHIYDFPGTHTVSIIGVFPRIYFNNSGDIAKIMTIEQWGAIRWESMESAFETCTNLTHNATDVPDLSGVTNMNQMFRACTQFNGSINNWDVSNITDMGQMLLAAVNFDQPLDSWDVFNVTNFNQMFDGAAVFDQSLGSWNIGNAMLLTGMLDDTGLSSVNYDATIKGWANLLQIPTNIQLGASGLTYCNPNDRNFLTGLGWTFTDAGKDTGCGFVTTWLTTTDNESITIPTTGLGYNYSVDWGDGTSTAGELGNTDHVYATAGTYTVSIEGDFPRIYFNQGNEGQQITKIMTIEQWGKVAWTSMNRAFGNCSNLIINAGDAPYLGNVTDMFDMFIGATSLNQNINGWDVSNVTNMQGMLFGAIQFNQPLDQWDVSNVSNMSFMFLDANAFNQDISLWNVSNVTTMSGMFTIASVQCR